MKQVYPEESAQAQRARELSEEDRYDLVVAAVHREAQRGRRLQTRVALRNIRDQE